MIEISKITMDVGMQSRAAISAEAVEAYRIGMEAGETFPPVVLFFTPERQFILADGWHRVLAAKSLGLTTIAEDVRPGSIRDAQLYAIGSNAAHGLQRTQADKRKAVMLMLSDSEWVCLSDSAISKACAVSRPLVASLRSGDQPTEVVAVAADGTTRVMSKKQKVAAQPVEPQSGQPGQPDRCDKTQEIDFSSESNDQLREAHDTICELNLQLEALEDRSSEQLHEQIKTLLAGNSALENRIAGLLAENAALKSACSGLRAQLAKK